MPVTKFDIVRINALAPYVVGEYPSSVVIPIKDLLTVDNKQLPTFTKAPSVVLASYGYYGVVSIGSNTNEHIFISVNEFSGIPGNTEEIGRISVDLWIASVD